MKKAGFQDLHKWPTIRNDTWKIFHDWANTARIKQLIPYIHRADSILELGCGYGYSAGIILKNILPMWYVGVDIDTTAIKSCNEMLTTNKISGNYSFIVGDMTKIHSYAKRPSLILCTETLEHVKDYNRALDIILSLVSTDARAIISVPRYNKLTAVQGHINNFNNEFFPNIFFKRGFKLMKELSICNMWNFYVIKKLPC